MTPPRTGPTPPAGLRRVAVLTLFAFGCATVRVPASTMSETVPVRGAVAEPQLELWLESGREVSPAESERATAEARAALESAIAGVSAPDGDAILVVRAQGVARTPSRRSDQRAAMTGIVVGAVVVVAAVVTVLVLTKGKGGGGGGRSNANVASARPAPPRPGSPPMPPPPRSGLPIPQSGSRVGRVVPRWPGIQVNVVAGVEVPPPGEPVPAAYGWDEAPMGWEPLAPAPAWAPPEEVAQISLPPPPPLDLASRGFFEGDTLRLELVVVDRRNGTPRWTKVVDGNVDPRDAQAVQRLLDAAVADEHGWMPMALEGTGAR